MLKTHITDFLVYCKVADFSQQRQVFLPQKFTDFSIICSAISPFDSYPAHFGPKIDNAV